jgi:type II secretory pathway pseudopilin PulG
VRTRLTFRVPPRLALRTGLGDSAHGSEAGDTLIEVLMAIVIIALAASALLGALLTSVTGSVEHRSLSVDDTVLKGFAEAAKEQIELQSTPLYAPCASNYLITPPTFPTGYSATITAIQYWNISAFQASCPSTDRGAQLITAKAVNSANGVSQTLSFVVRNPGYAP